MQAFEPAAAGPRWLSRQETRSVWPSARLALLELPEFEFQLPQHMQQMLYEPRFIWQDHQLDGRALDPSAA